MGDDAVLNAGNYTSFIWSTGAVTQTITVSTAGDYTVTVTDANGCQATTMVTILVNPLPTPVITAVETSGITDNDGILCMGDEAVLNVGTYSDYQWSTGESTVTITVSTAGDYTVTVTDGTGCEATATITIIVNPIPVSVITVSETSGTVNDDGIICTGDIATLDAGTFVTYAWSSGGASQTEVVTAGGELYRDGNRCKRLCRNRSLYDS